MRGLPTAAAAARRGFQIGRHALDDPITPIDFQHFQCESRANGIAGTVCRQPICAALALKVLEVYRRDRVVERVASLS